MATCKVRFKEEEAIITYLGEHNHPAEEMGKKIYKKTREAVVNYLKDDPNIKPSEIITKITSNLNNDELRDVRNIPTPHTISDIKYGFIHSNFPSRDHFFNILYRHGEFDGSSHFIRMLSFFPLIIVMMTEESIIRSHQTQNKIVLLDTTHSTTNPSLYLTSMLLMSESTC
jgi:hypothetical protein